MSTLWQETPLSGVITSSIQDCPKKERQAAPTACLCDGVQRFTATLSVRGALRKVCTSGLLKWRVGSSRHVSLNLYTYSSSGGTGCDLDAPSFFPPATGTLASQTTCTERHRFEPTPKHTQQVTHVYYELNKAMSPNHSPMNYCYHTVLSGRRLDPLEQRVRRSLWTQTRKALGRFETRRIAFWSGELSFSQLLHQHDSLNCPFALLLQKLTFLR